MGPRSAAAESILEHFRSPILLPDFQIGGEQVHGPGYFEFGPETVCYGRCTVPETRSHPTGVLYDALTHATVEYGVVRLPMDAQEVIDNLRHERYCLDQPLTQARLGEIATIRKLYYHCLRPFLPVAVRKYLQRAHLRNWRDIPFPQWPIDSTVDRILERLLALAMQAQGLSRVPFIWFWPDGASSAAVMTHDVESVAGRNFCSELMDLDDSVGIRSSFQLVPEKRYSMPGALLDEMHVRGFEVNIHDLNHDGRLFTSRERFLRRAELLNEYGRMYGARGFRSGGLYRNQAWYGALDFAYDMSVPNSAHLEPQAGGCCSVTPFFIGKILELPLTTTQDYSLFHILNDYSIDLWARQLQLIDERHGVATFIVHPDYILETRARRTYQRLLEHLARRRDEHGTWIARPGEVNRWWRNRRAMTLVRDGETWRIEGPDKERARLAYARLNGSTLTFELADTMWVHS